MTNKNNTIIQFTWERWDQIIRQHEQTQRRAEQAEHERDHYLRKYCKATGKTRTQAETEYQQNSPWHT